MTRTRRAGDSPRALWGDDHLMIFLGLTSVSGEALHGFAATKQGATPCQAFGGAGMISREKTIATKRALKKPSDGLGGERNPVLCDDPTSSIRAIAAIHLPEGARIAEWRGTSLCRDLGYRSLPAHRRPHCAGQYLEAPEVASLKLPAPSEATTTP